MQTSNLKKISFPNKDGNNSIGNSQSENVKKNQYLNPSFSNKSKNNFSSKQSNMTTTLKNKDIKENSEAKNTSLEKNKDVEKEKVTIDEIQDKEVMKNKIQSLNQEWLTVSSHVKENIQSLDDLFISNENNIKDNLNYIFTFNNILHGVNSEFKTMDQTLNKIIIDQENVMKKFEDVESELDVLIKNTDTMRILANSSKNEIFDNGKTLLNDLKNLDNEMEELSFNIQGQLEPDSIPNHENVNYYQTIGVLEAQLLTLESEIDKLTDN